MILDDCCPYCGSEDIFFKDSRLDYVGGILVETNFGTCKNCEKRFQHCNGLHSTDSPLLQSFNLRLSKRGGNPR